MTIQFGSPTLGPQSASQCTMEAGAMDTSATYQDNTALSSSYPDHSLYCVDLSAYASSPNSLFMYEQERCDMANSYDTCRFMSNCVKMEECDDLSPGFENTSVNMWRGGESYPSRSVDNPSPAFLESWPGNDLGTLNMDDIFQVDTKDVTQGPTLAELNAQDSMHYIDDVRDMTKVRCMDTGAGTVCFEDDEIMKLPSMKMANTARNSVAYNSKMAASVPTVVPQMDALAGSGNVTLSQLLDRKVACSGTGARGLAKPMGKCTQSKAESVIESRPTEQLDENLMKKWEEIKEFIHSDAATTSGATTTPEKIQRVATPVKIKTEPENEHHLLADQNDDDWSKMSDGSEDEEEDDDDAMSDIGQRAMAGIVHGGKQRRGDGNDIAPNPRKMYNIGLELKKINKLINDMTPVSELPVNVRPRSRREKNKLASRACRLKKKAQHEANKVKLFGLDQEHERLNTVLTSIKEEVHQRLQEPGVKHEDKMSAKLQSLIHKHLSHMIAGHTTEFVNSVMEKVAGGDSHGGLRNN